MMEQAGTFYELLGLSREATPEQISERFRQLVMEHHPDRFQEPEKKAEAEQFLKEITEAYNTLSKPHLRSDYDKSLNTQGSQVLQQKTTQEQTKELVLQAQAKLRAGDYSSALSLLDHVLRLEPENDQALYHSGMLRLKSPKLRAQGSQLVEKAIEKNPFNPAYVIGYAEFLMDNSQTLRAQRLLEAALQNMPNDARVIELLEQTRGEKSSGFSLFRKKT
jgi:curved DNA-binding protein CbpA